MQAQKENMQEALNTVLKLAEEAITLHELPGYDGPDDLDDLWRDIYAARPLIENAVKMKEVLKRLLDEDGKVVSAKSPHSVYTIKEAMEILSAIEGKKAVRS